MAVVYKNITSDANVDAAIKILLIYEEAYLKNEEEKEDNEQKS